jgi:hypothetical protein
MNNVPRQTNPVHKYPQTYTGDYQRQAFKALNMNSETANTVSLSHDLQKPMNPSDLQNYPGYEKPDFGKMQNTGFSQGYKNTHYPNNYDKMVGAKAQNEVKAHNTLMSPPDELDSRNEIFAKSETDPIFSDRKPLSNLQVAKNNPHSSMVAKSKNMHAKINRGISPNQPPQNKMKTFDSERKKAYQPASVGKHPVKESADTVRRSSSLKVKKDNDRISNYKPSSSTRSNHKGGGSFIVPSNNPKNKKEGEIPKNTKCSTSAQNIKNNYSKNTTGGITNQQNSSSNSGHYRLGSNYGMRNPGGSNFTANSRIRKPNASSNNAHNTMASFRSGPVRVVGDNPNNRQITNTSNNGAITHSKKDASKRPSSAGKANKKSSKIATKPSNRPGTASTRGSSNRPPSPGSRSLKSDLLFNSYNRNK